MMVKTSGGRLGVFGLVFVACFLGFGIPVCEAQISDDTPVYYAGGKRGHIEGCRRLDQPTNTTYGEMVKQGGQLCSRCPGSQLNQEREAGSGAVASTPAVKPSAPASGGGGFSNDTPVYYTGGKRGHIVGCRRLDQPPNTTYGEMIAQGGQLCSRCPGSELNQQREANGATKKTKSKKDSGGDSGKYGRKGAKARAAWLEIPEKEYDPNTKAVCDALWMRVHEESCPALILKEKKQYITLEQADKEGWRIGENGQSGRERCCFHGYRRKHPEKDFTDDTPGITQIMKSGKLKWHQAGCHRFTIDPVHQKMTLKEAEQAGANHAGFYVCEHCLERGPNRTTADMEELRNRPTPPTFTPPAGWAPKPFSPNELPSKQEIDLLIQETLGVDYGIQEASYEERLASLEEFMGRRFFFPVGNWLTFYQAYRATGDKRILDSLRVSARHYRDLCDQYLDVAQIKASDPEGLAFLYSMAVSARITLQLARKGKASQEEIAEAAGFLKAIVAVLKPICEGDTGLDPEMGIPKPLADDFRSRAFNRAANGIGTIAMTAKALEDLQAITKATALQPTIDRYRKCVQEWVKNWKKEGCLYTEADGKTYFYYPYSAGGKTTRRPDGLLLGGADDVGHYSHSMQGVMLMYDATPELGADDDFMTAIANAVYHNSYTKNGSIQCPTADKIKPLSRHPHSDNPKDRFYMFEAFRDGVIDGQCSNLNPSKKKSVLSEYSHRLKTLHAQYMKALRSDRSLIHLGEKM